MNYESIQCSVDDRILTMVLNRPDKLNAVTEKMLKEMIDAFDQADRDDRVRVVIVTGAGRAFCAGADLSNRENTWMYHSEKLEEHRDAGGLVTLKIFEMKKPVIAAINGAAVGFGITMTLPMDIRIASESARMGFAFTRRGIVPDACCTWFLPRIVGIGRAAEWTLTGRVFSAREAMENGLVSRVEPQKTLLKKAREIAREIADNTSAVSVGLTRQLLWRMLGEDHPMEAHKIDSQCIYYLGKSPDSSEGVRSFLEKRPPAFPMKPSSDMPGFYPWWKDRSFK
ncbi:MAG TPA: crotonase/enoyl-CoA hydratase family protein [Thermodesulfobacteriota bacterium]|nr:crotonase/enoyl-CoA hydratase family protein [Thermodesulfobacteriota bacterium]